MTNPSSSTTRMLTRSCSPWPTRSSATTAPFAPATTTRWCALSMPAARARPSSSSAAPAASRPFRSRWPASQRNEPTLRPPVAPDLRPLTRACVPKYAAPPPATASRAPRKRLLTSMDPRVLTMLHVRHPFVRRRYSPWAPSRRTRSRSRAMPRRSCRSISATWRTPRPTTRGSRRRTATRRCSRSRRRAWPATCTPSTSRRSGRTTRAARATCPSPRCSTTTRTSCRLWASTGCPAPCAASRSTARATVWTAPSGAARCFCATSARSSGSRTSPTCPCRAARRR